MLTHKANFQTIQKTDREREGGGQGRVSDKNYLSSFANCFKGIIYYNRKIAKHTNSFGDTDGKAFFQ